MPTNVEIVDAFVATLLDAPELVVQAVNRRLENTRYEMKLLKADPFKEADEGEAHIYQFPPQIQIRMEEQGIW